MVRISLGIFSLSLSLSLSLFGPFWARRTAAAVVSPPRAIAATSPRKRLSEPEYPGPVASGRLSPPLRFRAGPRAPGSDEKMSAGPNDKWSSPTYFYATLFALARSLATLTMTFDKTSRSPMRRIEREKERERERNGRGREGEVVFKQRVIRSRECDKRHCV